MAVDDYMCRDTNDLILPKKRIFPTNIPISHWQLRHYVSLPEPDHLYFATRSDVWCLNPSTQKRTHVSYLPFEARCTASGYGWVCVGGEDNGDFACIRITSSLPADVDALLPLDFGTSGSGSSSLSAIAPRVKRERIGDEIVNSVSVHRLPATAVGESDEVVAVLTNNDKTVRIYSLTHLMETHCLNLPIPVNHATISPDGNILVAVGDAPQAFFFERIRKNKEAESRTTNTFGDANHYWHRRIDAKLHSPKEATNCCYFSTAWSPSGTICAIGSECGYISIFDSALLSQVEFGEDAIVRILASSRPKAEAGPGAIRSMLFAPEAWDLLIWSEDSGRVCIGDIRTGLRTKQVIHLDQKDKDLERMEVINIDDPTQADIGVLNQEAEFIRRYRRALDADDTGAAVNFANEYLGASFQRRERIRLSARLSDELDDDSRNLHGLTNEERAILEALRTTRQREEARNNGTQPRSITYTSASMFDRDRTAGVGQHGGADFPSLQTHRTTSTAEQTNRLSSRLGSLREHLSDPQSVPERPPWQPRRRNSIIISNTNSSPDDSTSPNPNTSSPPLTSTDPPTSRDYVDSARSLLESWRTIDAAMQRDRDRTHESRERRSVAPRPTYSANNLLNIARDTNARDANTFQAPSPASISNDLSRLRQIRENLVPERQPSRPLTPERLLRLRREIQEAGLPPLVRANDMDRGGSNIRSLPGTHAAGGDRERDGTSTPPHPVPLDTTQELRRLRTLVRARERSNRLNNAPPSASHDPRNPHGPLRGLATGGNLGVGIDIAGLAGRANPEWGVRTAGLAISGDGRKLFVGSEEGVWEIGIDVAGRRFCPAVEVR
ncbi:MAG: hypothetical protein M1820_008599 [Bogoriella megaspora]|nr:MAG: hypothetical protein M1820_008599 [Bogoriella megaspora]